MLDKDQIDEWTTSEEYWSEPSECDLASLGFGETSGRFVDFFYVEDELVEQDSSEQYWSETPKSYPTPLEMTKHYQKVTGQELDPELYVELTVEEWKEWRWEYNSRFSVEHNRYEPRLELKELADLIYVIYGYANARGWDLDEALYRVHSNNLGRMYQPDGSIKRREDGKIIRNKDYPKPDLSDLV